MKLFGSTPTCALAAVLAASCTPAPETALRVEFGGCLTVLDGPVCIVGEQPVLTIWLADVEPDAVRFTAAGDAIAAAGSQAVQGGTRYTLELPVPADSLHVSVDTGAARAAWRLALQTEKDPVWLQTATSHRRAGKIDAARESLDPALADRNGPRSAAAWGLLGRLELADGNHAAAQANLRTAMELAESQERYFEALTHALVLTFSLLHGDRQYTAARAVLDRFGADSGHAERAYFLAYHRGDAAAETGDSRGALREFAAAADIAARHDWQPRRLHASQLLAVQLQSLGRRAEARAIFDEWSGGLPAEIGGCARGLFFTNVGWSELLALEAGEAAGDPLVPLRRALELIGEHCTAADVANAHVNLALAYVHAGDAERAALHLEKARTTVADPPLRLALWALDIEARIALTRGDPARAAELYRRLERLADATLSPAARWRAAVGQAIVAQADGRADAAVAAFRRADRLVSEDIARIPLTEGRESFVATRQWATRQHLATLLDTGDQAGAYRLARRARQRVLYALSPADQVALQGPAARATWEQALARYESLRAELGAQSQRRWSVPVDELAQFEMQTERRWQELRSILDAASPSTAASGSLPARPAPGELLVLLHELDTGWAVFADDGNDVAVSRRACDPAAPEAARCLLGPLAATLATARRVLLLPGGRAGEIDFHRLTLGAAPLGVTVPVVYAADLPARRSAPPDRGKVLVVADPFGDLPGARAESAAVLAALDSPAWRATVLQGGAADANSVRQRLAGSDLFHFAGHASAGGTRGWESELHLAGDTVLTIADILALPDPPSTVVLSGCETAATVSGETPDSISLANAFIASGSDAVIATTRPVPDRITGRLMTAFYARWQAGAGLADALRAAQREVLDADPSADWAAFRLIARTPPGDH